MIALLWEDATGGWKHSSGGKKKKKKKYQWCLSAQTVIPPQHTASTLSPPLVCLAFSLALVHFFLLPDYFGRRHKRREGKFISKVTNYIFHLKYWWSALLQCVICHLLLWIVQIINLRDRRCCWRIKKILIWLRYLSLKSKKLKCSNISVSR